MFGKSPAEIQRRRALKQQTVAALEQACCLGAVAVSGNGDLEDEEVNAIQLVINPVLIVANAQAILTAAKGCTAPPPGINRHQHRTLWSFLSAVRHRETADCMGMWVADAKLWAKQLIARNPNSFNATRAGIFDMNVAQAKVNLEARRARFFQNPTARPPEIQLEAGFLVAHMYVQTVRGMGHNVDDRRLCRTHITQIVRNWRTAVNALPVTALSDKHRNSAFVHALYEDPDEAYDLYRAHA